MPTVNPNNIESLIMHRGAMLLLDEVIEHDQQQIVARAVVTPDSPCATTTGVTALICIEYMAQAVAAHASLITQVRQEGMLLGTRRLDLAVAEIPFGRCLQIRASSIFSTVSELGMYDCEVVDQVEDTIIATAKIKAVRSNNLVGFLISVGQLEGQI